MLHLSGPIPIGQEYNTLNYGRESLESFQGPPVHYQGTDVTSHFNRQHHMVCKIFSTYNALCTIK